MNILPKQGENEKNIYRRNKEIERILGFYPFGSVIQATKAGGTANLNWIVQTKKGTRLCRDNVRTGIRPEHHN